jgi:hypothetical protein
MVKTHKVSLEDHMKQQVGILTIGLAMLSLGIIVGMSLQPDLGAAAIENTPTAEVATPPIAEGALADGAPLFYPELSQAEGVQSANQTAASPVYYRTYAGIEFQPSGSDLTYSPYGTGISANTIPAGGLSFKRALDLPNGAQVNRISMYAIDNNATNNMTMGVVRNDPSQGTTQSYLTSFSTNNLITASTVQTVTVSGLPIFTVDNSRFDYCLRYEPVIAGTNHTLVGAKVEFTLPTAYLPMINK